MKQRPWPLVILALFHILAPIGNILSNSIMSHKGFFEYAQGYLLPGNLWIAIVYLGIPVLCGITIYACKKWSLFAYFTLMCVLLGFNLYALHTRNEITNMIPIVIIFVVNVLIVAYFMIPAVRSIYLDPRLRWWEAAPRYRANFECQFSMVGEAEGSSLLGEVANFSIGGVFLKAKQLPLDKSQIEIRFNYNNCDYNFTGHVIHHGQQNAVGVGVQFALSKDKLKLANSLAKDLDRDDRLIKDRLPGPEDSFFTWLRQLFQGGTGIVPKNRK